MQQLLQARRRRRVLGRQRGPLRRLLLIPIPRAVTRPVLLLLLLLSLLLLLLLLSLSLLLLLLLLLLLPALAKNRRRELRGGGRGG